MGVCSRSKRRRRDLINHLGDDVLLHILELLPDARDAVRTGALSLRWRGLWTRLPALRFASGSRPEFRGATGAERYIAFVNDALTQRSQEDAAFDLEHLASSFAADPTHGHEAEQLVPSSIAAARGWIWCAVQHAVKSFILELNLPRGNKGIPVMLLDELPSSAKLETMRLALGGVTVRLPAATVFVSLMDLSLESIEFTAGSGYLLTRLLSSACCPLLQKLQIRNLRPAGRMPGQKELLIEAAALSELSLERVRGL